MSENNIGKSLGGLLGGLLVLGTALWGAEMIDEKLKEKREPLLDTEPITLP